MPFVADKKTVGGFLENIGSSTANLAGSTAGAILNPYETVKNVISLAKNPQVVIDYYKKRYGKDLLETLYTDPVGVASDLSVLLGGVGGLAKLGGASEVARVASTASKFADPLQIASMAGSKVVGKLNLPGKFTRASESILTKGLGNPAKQAAIESKYGITAPQFIKKYGLYDRSPESLVKLEKSLGEQYANVSKTSKATFDPAKIVSDIDAKIAELSTGNAGLSSANQQMVKELAKRREQFVSLFKNKQNLPISELTSFRKQAIDPDIPMSEFGLSPSQAGKSAGTKKVRDILRANINVAEPRLKELGIDISVAKGYKPVFSGSRTRGANRQVFGIPKQGATIGTILGGVPGLVGGAALDYATNNPKVLGFFSRRLESAGEKLSKPIAIPTYVKTGYDVAKAARTVNLPMSEQKETIEISPLVEKKQGKQGSRELPEKSYIDYSTPKHTSPIKYKSPKLKISRATLKKIY